jgi:hypothetical protein
MTIYPCPKPQRKRPTVIITRDGMLRCRTQYEWDKLRKIACDEAHQQCQNCERDTPLSQGDLHHVEDHGRGMGGGKRDDNKVAWWCRKCHRGDES